MNTRPDGYEVVKWYTRARRFPQLIGKTPDGARIWGGPYTYTQVVGAAVVLVVGVKTVTLWGRLGMIGNAVLLLAITYTVALLLGRLPVGSRNPLAVGAGVLRALWAPAGGRCGGSPVRLRRPHRAPTRVVISPPTRVPAGAGGLAGPPLHAAAAGAAAAVPRAALWLRRLVPRRRGGPAPAVPAGETRAAVGPALSAVQRLLASSGQPPGED